MHWFRTHIRHGSRLALLALAIQFVLVFGHSHVHAHDTARPQWDSIAQAVDSESGGTGLLASADDQHEPHKHRPLADGCAICVVASLTAAAVFGASPILNLPDAVTFLYRVTDAGFAHGASAHSAFQPRAPPAS